MTSEPSPPRFLKIGTYAGELNISRRYASGDDESYLTPQTMGRRLPADGDGVRGVGDGEQVENLGFGVEGTGGLARHMKRISAKLVSVPGSARTMMLACQGCPYQVGA